MGHQSKYQLGATLSNKTAYFKLWAPFAKTVDIISSKDRPIEKPLTKKGDYWYGDLDDAEAGQAYKYRLVTAYGQTLYRNDPYARQLTSSEDGMSVIIDYDFDWQNTTTVDIPKNKQVIYELHIGTFNRPDPSTSGTFYTATQKLDYLAELGINMIELMPVTSMAASYGWGYAPNYLFSIENSYGGRHGLLEFIRACHKKGIGVIIDIVYNHFFPSTDLWQFDGWSENERGGIYFYNDERGDTPWGGRPDYGRPEVRQFILDNVTMWLTEFKIDGMRIDSTIYMRNSKGPDGDKKSEIADAWSLLQEINNLAHKINPDFTMIAEDSSVEPNITRNTDEGGAGFDAQWGLAFPHVVREALELESNSYGDTIEKELTHNYDESVFQKVIFSDSHDTASNGAVRLNEASSPQNAESIMARSNLLVASSLMLTAPGIPMLLQGEEFLQEGSFNDWKMLEWDKTEQFEGIVLANSHLINLRKNKYGNTAGLTGENINIFHDDQTSKVLAYHRWDKGGACDDVIVIVNLSNKIYSDYKISLPVSGTWVVRFNSSWKGYSQDFRETKLHSIDQHQNQPCTIELASKNVLILSRDS